MKFNSLDYIQAAFAAIGAFISAKLGIAYPAFLMLLAFMLLDYITGMLAAKKLGKWKSSVGVWGAIKKVLYAMIVCIAVAIDWIIVYYTEYIGFTIPIHSFFGAMVTLWFLFNELISITENCLKLETHLPAFFTGFLAAAKKVIDTSGEDFTSKISNKEGDPVA